MVTLRTVSQNITSKRVYISERFYILSNEHFRVCFPYFQNMEQCIKQNNAVEIYEDYFCGADESTLCEKPESKTVHVFRDPSSSHKRPVSSISW